jgi:hypothetical protein
MAVSFDFAIVGSNTLSLLLCGVLARDHGAKVVRVGRSPSPERLPRGPDLALLSATRPDSWRLLRDGDAETRRLLAAIGAGVTDVDVEMVADTERTRTAFDHVAHLAAGYRQPVRQVSGRWLFQGVTLVPPQAPLLTAWLDTLGVKFIDADSLPLPWMVDGSPRIAGVEAGQVVLADDEVILDLDESVRSSVLRADAMTMTLLDRAPARRQPIRVYPDRQVVLMPRDASTMLARIRNAEALDERLGSSLVGPFPIRRLATARYRALSSLDGAPVVGSLGGAGPYVVAGLEEAAPFFAPALARHLKGSATPDEVAWFAAHAPIERAADIVEFAP